AGKYYSRQYEKFIITAKPSFSDAKALVIDRSDIAYLGNNEYSVAAQVINPNLDLAAKSVAYEMNFYGPDGKLAAAAQKGEFYLLPNQRKYLVAPKVVSSAGISRSDLVLLSEIKWQKKLNLPEVKLIANLPKGGDQKDPFGYALEGSITNNSPYYLKEVRLVFLLYGTGGKVIGASERVENSFQPFEKRAYKQIWPGVSGINVVRAETYPETNLLDKENFTLPEPSENTEAGDLGR
ncbi:MAG: hypothetical protein Q7K28_01390, partial [Candidatus Wildermuthbacteria bacterium]|nr:hypothetical protein [Candidatus Wildermuthbacteria bacterium]